MAFSAGALRALLADDVKLHQSVGRADVGLFFTIYAKFDGVWLAPAWLEGREFVLYTDGNSGSVRHLLASKNVV
jgi:hypothetical protein